MDTASDCVDVRDRRGGRRGSAVGYAGFVVVLAVFLGVSFTGAYGVHSATVEASGGGYELAVRYGRTTRPALATPFEIDVRRAGGFDGPVTIAVTSAYFEIWDENAVSPSPSSETSDGEWQVWEFDPPDGPVLAVGYDARIEPAAQSGRRGRVEVRDAAGAPVVGVSFETRVLP